VERLHHFEAFVKDKKQALEQELEALGKGPKMVLTSPSAANGLCGCWPPREPGST